MDANTWRPATPPPPGGPPPMRWMTGSGNVTYLKTNDASRGGAAFNHVNSFCTGISLTNNPVPSPYVTTPVLNLSSYTNSSTATVGSPPTPNPGLVGDGTTGPNGGLLPKNAITFDYKYIAYDNEVQASTPVAEQHDPVTYMQDFITACHGNGYNVILAPGYGLFTSVTVHAPNPGETQEQWFVRVIVGLGAAGLTAGDVFVLQNEEVQNSGTYKTLWNDTASKLGAVSPHALAFAEVSSSQGVTGTTGPALGTQMATNAQTLTNPYPNGFYVAMPILSGESTGGVHQSAGMYFLDDMLAAGYTSA